MSRPDGNELDLLEAFINGGESIVDSPIWRETVKAYPQQIKDMLNKGWLYKGRTQGRTYMTVDITPKGREVFEKYHY